jgi:hypothetical protein
MSYESPKGGVRTLTTTLNGSTPVQVLGPGNGRVTVILSATESIAVTYSYDPGVSDGVGMYMPDSVRPLVLRRCDLGDVIDMPIWAVSASGTPTVAITEIM